MNCLLASPKTEDGSPTPPPRSPGDVDEPSVRGVVAALSRFEACASAVVRESTDHAGRRSLLRVDGTAPAGSLRVDAPSTASTTR